MITCFPLISSVALPSVNHFQLSYFLALTFWTWVWSPLWLRNIWNSGMLRVTYNCLGQRLLMVRSNHRSFTIAYHCSTYQENQLTTFKCTLPFAFGECSLRWCFWKIVYQPPPSGHFGCLSHTQTCVKSLGLRPIICILNKHSRCFPWTEKF